jgi:DNA-binding transcriptional LysR family regulator
MDGLPDLDAMVAFVRVVTEGSISRAAAVLRTPRATVGRRLERLEEDLGVRLLRRTTRRVALTDAGRVFFEHATRAIAAVEEARSAVHRSTDVVRGDLRVAAPPLNPSLRGVIVAFAAEHPAVRLQVRTGTEHVDLVASGYDVAVRATSQLAPGLVMRRLHRDPLVAVASPAYLDARGRPAQVADLAAHDCVVGFDKGDVPASHWVATDGARVQVRARFTSNDLGLLVHAARAGLGVALLPRSSVETSLRRGELEVVLPDVFGREITVAVVYPEKAHLPPAVRAFVDAVAAPTSVGGMFQVDAAGSAGDASGL